MDYTSIKTGLEGFVERYDSQTYIGSYRETNRSSLLKEGLSTRANSLWKMAEYVIARCDETDDSIEEYIKGWRQLASGAGNQFLLLEESKDSWSMYDSQGNKLGGDDYIADFFLRKKKRNPLAQSKNVYPLQQIFYGAPGTGKSHKIKENEWVKNAEEKKLVFRTTFHPDSDYSTFVGAYKPTMKPVADKYKAVAGKDEEITYSFVPQAFLQSYVAAWKNQDEKVFLIIEEINRGNCAQIFGDLFQLLDRDENGVSEYKIKADADIRTYLADVLGKDSDGIKDGELCLPKNLYIWATMNTSDQSLFPIDSAFKRRWDWEYEPIKYSNKEWKIEIDNNKYSWTSFQKKVNDRIFRDLSSEDKMLGDYFVNPRDGIISEKLLLNKILFYLWNDVCKDGDGDIFKTEDNKEVKFSELYGDEGTEKLLSMMKHLKVELVIASDEDVENDENSKDNTKYSINGSGSYAKRALSTELVKVYISQHPEMPATEVVNKWKNLGNFVSHFIETQDEYDKRTDQNPRVNIIQCNGDKIYVSTNGWGGQGVMDSLIGAIPKDWNLNVEKI